MNYPVLTRWTDWTDGRTAQPLGDYADAVNESTGDDVQDTEDLVVAGSALWGLIGGLSPFKTRGSTLLFLIRTY